MMWGTVIGRCWGEIKRFFWIIVAAVLSCTQRQGIEDRILNFCVKIARNTEEGWEICRDFQK